MSELVLYPRFAEERLVEALADSPVVLVHGPRQCGKTTLARAVGGRLDYTYITFDDPVARAAAIADPVGFVADLPRRTILDEVQHVPALFSTIKLAVDRDRYAGRFILTGSSNILLVPALSDSLAGRMEILRLHPLAQCELERRESGFLDVLFGAGFGTWQTDRLGRDLASRISRGGYPTALERASDRRRTVWYRNYIEAIVQRDVREMSRISSLDVLPRLLAVAAAQSATLLNVTSLAAPFQLSRPTIRDYLTLLERVFVLDVLPPWHTNLLSRVVKTPKLHVGDSGVACALLSVDTEALVSDRQLLGRLCETFVLQELRRHASFFDKPLSFYHYRDKDAAEVDIVVEQGSHAIAGVEVKVAGTVAARDFRGLRKLRDLAGDRFVRGVVLYDGETAVSFGDRIHALPLRALWERW